MGQTRTETQEELAPEGARRPSPREQQSILVRWVFGAAIAVFVWFGWTVLAPTLGFPELAPAAMLNRALHVDPGSRWGWAALVLAISAASAAFALAVHQRFMRSGVRSGLLFGAGCWLVIGAIAMPLLALAVPDAPITAIPGPAEIPGMPVPADPEAMRPTFMMLHLGILAPFTALIGWLLVGAVLGATSSVAEPSIVVVEGASTRSPRGLVLLAGSAALVVLGATLWVVAHPVEAEALSCGPGFGRRITGVVVGDVEVTTHGTICAIRGTVKGSVIVRDVSDACTKRDLLTAIHVIGGTIEGNIRAEGRRCVMVWLRDGARVVGGIDYGGRGNLGFLGDDEGATVQGDVLVRSGLLWATGASTTNRIDGDLVCQGAQPVGGPGSGSADDWDGLDEDADGSIGGAYRC
ncbi:MAG: polymer-forming cytoskeletal protein [Actinobacteria bacterium]|nr:polymer-forming cytoskeletal protein [Actinomycetota bacterium]